MATLRRIHERTHVGTDKYGAAVLGPPLLLFAAAGTEDELLFDADSPACRVLDAWGVMTAAGSAGEWSITDGTNVIVTPVDVELAGDKDITRSAEIDDAFRALSAGGTLKVTRSGGGVDADVYVLVSLT